MPLMLILLNSFPSLSPSRYAAQPFPQPSLRSTHTPSSLRKKGRKRKGGKGEGDLEGGRAPGREQLAGPHPAAVILAIAKRETNGRNWHTWERKKPPLRRHRSQAQPPRHCRRRGFAAGEEKMPSRLPAVHAAAFVAELLWPPPVRSEQKEA
ncbi:uncharacterized protein DS421_15g507600 [Arachis hypogaea]|nr:uncharacterized protein DS421_15g507600 [Arachis hypogaea]